MYRNNLARARATARAIAEITYCHIKNKNINMDKNQFKEANLTLCSNLLQELNCGIIEFSTEDFEANNHNFKGYPGFGKYFYDLKIKNFLPKNLVIKVHPEYYSASLYINVNGSLKQIAFVSFPETGDWVSFTYRDDVSRVKDETLKLILKDIYQQKEIENNYQQ